jgi:hypothetical protein
MPQCQFPVFCCFCVSEKLHSKYSRNWTKQGLKLLFFPDKGRGPKESQRGARGQARHEGARPPSWPRPGVVRPPGGPLTPPLRLFKASVSKTLKESVFFPEQFRSAAAIEDKFWGTEVSVPTPCRDGEVPPEPSPSPSPSTSPPSPSPLLPPMMRREYFSPGAEGSTGSYVVHLSLP